MFDVTLLKMSAKLSEYIIDVGGGAYNEYVEWIRTRPGLEIHAIEPHPELAAVLRNKTEFVHEVLIGDGSKPKEDLIIANQLSCSSTLPFEMSNIRRWKYPAGAKMFCNIGSISCKSISLSQFIEQHIPKFKPIDLLNIDVQGNTLPVLRGITKDDWERIQKIMVKVFIIDWELYQHQSNSDEVLKMITDHGYHRTSEHVISRGQEKRVIFERNMSVEEQKRTKAHTLIRTTASVTAAAKLNPPKPAKKIIGSFKVPRL